MHLNAMRAALCAGVVLGSTAAWATEITLVMPSTGNDVAYLQDLSKKYEKLTGDTVKITWTSSRQCLRTPIRGRAWRPTCICRSPIH